MRDIIIIPTYNERGNIKNLLQTIHSLFPNIFMLVVDDNSPDQTAREVRLLQEEIPNVELLVRPRKEGLGKAYMSAFKKILEEGNVRLICTMDADFSHSVTYLRKMIDAGKEFDVVVGSRYIAGGRVRSYPFLRRMTSMGGSLYCRMLFGLSIKDYTSGFMCIRAPLLAKIDWKEIHSTGFAFLIELKYLLCRKGCVFKEFPIVLESRREGESKIGIRIVLEGIFLPWRLIFENCQKRLKGFFLVLGESIKKRGFFYILQRGPQVLFCTYMNRKRGIFVFQNKEYRYFHHIYNGTCLNERSVEIPIAWELIQRYRGKRILEVGNVLAHYFPCGHDVVDKYEKSDGVINSDIVDFRPQNTYDLIVSISTLEHVGFDEEIKDPKKILYAIENIKSILAPKGKTIITLCLGYNPELDRFLEKNVMQFTELYFLKREPYRNVWREVGQSEVRGISYNYSLWTAQGLAIGIIEK